MAHSLPENLTGAIERAVQRANSWASTGPSAAPGARVRALLTDDAGRDFTRNLIESVFRPDTLSAAASSLHRVAPAAPRVMSWPVRAAVRVGGAVAPILPAPVVPLTKTAVTSAIGTIVTDARAKRVSKAAENAAEHASRVESALATVLPIGNESAAAYRRDLRSLIDNPAITSVSYRLGDAVFVDDPWSFAQTIDAAVDAVAELYEAAAAAGTRLMLDVRELRELDLALGVLTVVLERPEFQQTEAGVIIAASLADSLGSVHELSAWAKQRVVGGGAPLDIRVSDHTASPAEIEQSALNAWPLPAVTGRTDVLAAVVRTLLWLTDHAEGVRIGVDSSDPLVLAFAAELGAELALPAGVATHWLDALAEAGTTVVTTLFAVDAQRSGRVTLPVSERVMRVADVLANAAAPNAESDAADANEDAAERLHEIVRRAVTEPALARNAIDRSIAPDWVLEPAVSRDDTRVVPDLTHAVMGIARNANETTPLSQVADRMLFGGAAYVETAVFSDFEKTSPHSGAAGFRNAQVTDPALIANREWASNTQRQEPRTTPTLPSPRDAVIEVRHGEGEWETYAAADRAAVLERAAYELALRRADLIAAARALGTRFADADRDVTTAIDYANYYASTVRELDTISGAVFVPHDVTVVTGNRADFIASAAEGVLSALAAGGAVVLAAVLDAGAIALIMREALTAAGVPDDAVRIARGDVTDADADALTLAGDVAAPALALAGTAALNARQLGVNTYIVTPSADIDETARAVVSSAFGRGGAAFESVSLVIVVGSIGRSARLKAALTEATNALAARTKREAAVARELNLNDLWALSTLEPGQQWLVEPQRVNESTYTPGIRVGVEPQHRFARERFTAPVLGVMAADSLTHAIALANQCTGGAVAGLATTNPADAAVFLRTMNAGSLYLGRSVLDPVVQRQPSGGWGASAIGTAAKAGGPNRLATLGRWRGARARKASGTLHLRGLDSRVVALIEAAQPDLDFDGFDWVRRAALADALAWDREFGHVRDVTKLGIERNLFRYRPTSLAVRATADTELSVIVRLVLAAMRTQATFVLSVAEGLPAGVRHALGDLDAEIYVESDDDFVRRMQSNSLERVRIVGASAAALAAQLHAQVARTLTVYADAATTAGRIELLAFLREQSITIGGRSVATFAEVI